MDLAGETRSLGQPPMSQVVPRGPPSQRGCRQHKPCGVRLPVRTAVSSTPCIKGTCARGNPLRVGNKRCRGPVPSNGFGVTGMTLNLPDNRSAAAWYRPCVHARLRVCLGAAASSRTLSRPVRARLALPHPRATNAVVCCVPATRGHAPPPRLTHHGSRCRPSDVGTLGVPVRGGVSMVMLMAGAGMPPRTRRG